MLVEVTFFAVIFFVEFFEIVEKPFHLYAPSNRNLQWYIFTEFVRFARRKEEIAGYNFFRVPKIGKNWFADERLWELKVVIILSGNFINCCTL